MFHILNSIFWLKFYAPGTLVITALHYYHIVLNFCQLNSVLEGFFRVLLFGKYFLGVMSVAKYFLAGTKISNSANPYL